LSSQDWIVSRICREKVKLVKGLCVELYCYICHFGFRHHSEPKHLQHLHYSMSKWVAAQGVEIGLPLQLLLVVSGSVSGIMPKGCMQKVS
jgi:hypothetical protein